MGVDIKNMSVEKKIMNLSAFFTYDHIN